MSPLWARKPPFRDWESGVLETFPSFYWVVGSFLHPAKSVHPGMPREAALQILVNAHGGLEMFLGQPSVRGLLPRSTEKATNFIQQLTQYIKEITYGSQVQETHVHGLNSFLSSFSVSFQDELDRLPMYTLIPKGNLSVHRLIKGATDGFAVHVLDAIDEFIKGEIDEAGKCLACERYTACGFHILRAVETAMKAYLHAAKGQLPPTQNRSWGTYIAELLRIQASNDLLDQLKVLKTKRNPLMHPTDSLEAHEAVTIFCLCQSALEELISEINAKGLATKFKAALAALPTI